MRSAIIASFAAVILVACSDGTNRPESSAHPELSGQEILDRVPEEEPEPKTARVTMIEESSGISGDERDESNSILVDHNIFLEAEGNQLLLFNEKIYTRESSSEPWETPEPRLERLFEKIEGFREDLFSELEEINAPTSASEVRRLPDEYIDDTHVVHIAFDLSFTDDEIAATNDAIRDAVAGLGAEVGVGVDTKLIPHIARMEGTFELWLEATTFEFRGYGITSKAWDTDDELVLSQKKVTKVSDVNEPLELPGPLPSVN